MAIDDWRQAVIKQIATLEAGHQAILRDLDAKHQANEKKWDIFTKRLDDLLERITNIRVENARWNVAAGVVTAGLIELIKHYSK